MERIQMRLTDLHEGMVLACDMCTYIIVEGSNFSYGIQLLAKNGWSCFYDRHKTLEDYNEEIERSSGPEYVINKVWLVCSNFLFPLDEMVAMKDSYNPIWTKEDGLSIQYAIEEKIPVQIEDVRNDYL